MDKKLVGLILIFVLVFSVFMGALILEAPIRTRAENSRVCSKCYLFADPVSKSVAADGRSAVKISVSASDAKLNICPNKTVIVEASAGDLDKTQTTTGESGIASFLLTSTKPTDVSLKAQVKSSETQSIACEPQSGVTVKFEEI